MIVVLNCRGALAREALLARTIRRVAIVEKYDMAAFVTRCVDLKFCSVELFGAIILGESSPETVIVFVSLPIEKKNHTRKCEGVVGQVPNELVKYQMNKI